MMLAIAVLFILIGDPVGSHADIGLTNRSIRKTEQQREAREFSSHDHTCLSKGQDCQPAGQPSENVLVLAHC